MTRYLVQIHDIRISYPDKDILLFDDDASGAFLHAKIHPQVEEAHTHSVGQILCMRIGPVFGGNVSPHNWKVFPQSRCKKEEHLQFSSNLDKIVQKHSTLVDLTQLPKYAEKYPSLVQAIAEKTNKGVITDGKWGPSQNSILID